MNSASAQHTTICSKETLHRMEEIVGNISCPVQYVSYFYFLFLHFYTVLLFVYPFSVAAREYTDCQRPLSGVHSINLEKLAQAGEGGGCTAPTPFYYILLGLPVFAKRSQTWTGLLDAERINRKSKTYWRVDQFTNPNRVSTQPRRMIDANWV